MPVKAQMSAGVAAISIGRRNKSGRPKGEPCGEYEAARCEEIKNRTAYYELKLKRTREQLLDRAIIARELAQVYEAIRTIISASPFSEREKADCLRNLRDVDELLEMVASRQNAELGSTNGGNGHRIDDEI
jgi:phage terminase Nu1 subunit (DNA packaging protein)